VTAVARIRSLVSARVVYRSRGKAPELRVGGLEDDEVGQPREHVFVVAVHRHHRRPDLASGTAEGVVVRGAAHGDPVPSVGLDGDPRAGDPRIRPGEVPRQAQREGLRLADALAGEGEHRVLLGVGGQHVGVVAGGVRGGEVPAQAGADGKVDQAVPRAVAVHRDDPHLGLAVLVAPEPDRHAPPLS
jgi:hypothetical protein